MAQITLKRMNTRLPIPDFFRTFQGEDGRQYIFLRNGTQFHAFVEVEAKQAAMNCGSKLGIEATTPQHCQALWDRRDD